MSGEVTFTATEADYVAANRLVLRHSKQLRVLSWIGWCGVGLAIVEIVLRMAMGDTIGAAISDATATILFCVVVLGVRVLIPRRLPQQVRQMMQQDLSLGEPVRCRWTDDVILFSGSNGTANLLWTRLHRWLQDDRVIVLLQTDRLMYILPKHSLTADQTHNLSIVAEEHLGKTSKQR